MNLFIRLFASILIILIAEWGFYLMLKNLIKSSSRKEKILRIIILIFNLLFFISVFSINIFVGPAGDDPNKYRQHFWVLNLFIIIYLPKLLPAFFLFISFMIRKIKALISNRQKTAQQRNSSGTYKVAAILYIIMLLIICHGFIFTKHQLKVRQFDLYFHNLPENFEGFSILQFSDTHLGSFSDTAFMMHALKQAADMNPDLLVFTGDMINNSEKEVFPYKEMLSKLKPPYGKFSIMGNHDLGDYFNLKKVANQDKITKELLKLQKSMGFTVLQDSLIFIRKGNDSIALAGVNNWGNFPFKRRGNLDEAISFADTNIFTILLTHDPDHWKEEARHHNYIRLTLSGHTHGMQLGIRSKWLNISPAALKYPYWGGLYKNGENYLYVSTGLGFSGFSGRIGIRPEIVIIRLHKKR